MTEHAYWCYECHRHKNVCACNQVCNIYTVRYKLTIDRDTYHTWCEERVSCISYDCFEAGKLVKEYILTTGSIWWAEDNEDHQVPIGPRDVTIVSVDLHTSDVGALVRDLNLPLVFRYEDDFGREY